CLKLTGRQRKRDADQIVFRSVEIDQQTLRRKLDSTNMEMAAIFWIMRLDVARVLLFVLELSLEDEIRSLQVFQFLLKRDAVVIAFGGCGHMFGVELDHRNPQLS